jgi:hypothetical protein
MDVDFQQDEHATEDAGEDQCAMVVACATKNNQQGLGQGRGGRG